MSLSRRLGAILAAAAVLFASAPAAAADVGLNKEGFWTVGRDDADAKSCMASILAQDGTVLIVQVAPGHVDFIVGGEKRMRRGKKGILTIDANSFDFEPLYTDNGKLFFFEDLNGRALAALPKARDVTVQLDGRQVLEVSVENTGVAGALGAAAECSNGKSGWWGPGVGAPAVPEKTARVNVPVFNKEGIWAIVTTDDPAVCVAQAELDADLQLQILSAAGRPGLAVGSHGADLPRGRKGRVETDSYAFDFKPRYASGRYLTTDKPLESQALLALASAKWIRVRIDGRLLLDAALEESGFAELLTSVAACSRGEQGWWSAGAPAAR